MKNFMTIVVLAIILFFLGYNLLKIDDVKNDPNKEKQIESTKTIKGSKGTFTLPCEAYIDGTDKDAKPPLTMMSGQVWADVKKKKRLCRVKHGTKVTILDYDSNYDPVFKIKAANCTGWITEIWLSNTKNNPIGDRIQ
jgi:uncharacterized alpha/beta hydrolase family protein